MNKLEFDRHSASKSRKDFSDQNKSSNHHFQSPSRCGRGSTKTDYAGFLKRVSRRRAKKGYAHNV